MTPIQVLHGQPTPEELATVLAVVQSRAATRAAAAAEASGPASAWTARSLRRLPAPGPHAWRTSLWPR
ncbi:acyl-CoA carboxylase subunit epsilon [Streptomyces sp. TLI_171]|uniref:acyl-CoA carboxylase subunit epsilon n=1 Tax=Streptomyces sp. TLI_171 TaxID=1938859 RepID=UPI000C1925BB|nr:acyl-CoA carboxylase subunit epsilon [Streptomyces sp. TLI_171]RKE19390.1 acyl-CoA carboxylase epsilon subunit-like protein [Streptomyces sp. TLI_171]